MQQTSLPFALRASRLRWQQAFALCSGLILTPAFAQSARSPDLAATVITSVAPLKGPLSETDPKQPRQPIPASDAGDYLKTIPGFALIREGGSNGEPVLRGMFGSRLNVLTNGGFMLGACPTRMDSPSAYIAPQTFDRLTVIKGPQTVLWGPGNSAGTVLFDRDPPAFSEADAQVDASLTVASADRFDKVLDASLGNSLGYLRFTGSHAKAGDYRDGDGKRVPSRWEKWSGDLALGWTPDSDTLLELSAGRADGEARYGGRAMDGAQFKRESLALRFERNNLGDYLQQLDARVYYNYADHVMDTYSLRTPATSGMMAGPMATSVDRRTLGARLALTWAFADYQLVTGVDGRGSEHRRRSASGIDTYRSLPFDKDAMEHTYGVFSELTWAFSTQQRLVSGARLDWSDARDYRRSLGSMGMTRANPTQGLRRQERLPSGFVRYEHDLQGNSQVYAGLGHVQRFPDYWELFSPGSGPAGSANAFAAVKPEKTTQLDVGWQYRDADLEAWVSAYAGQVRDFILFNYSSMGMMSTSQAYNVDARIMGAELGGAYRLATHWKTDASLAYAWGKNSSDQRALPQIPPLELRLGLAYERDDWSLGGLWRWVDGQGRTALGQGNVIGRDFAASSSFAVASLNGRWRASEHLSLSAGIDNLFDRTYREHLNLAGNAGFDLPAEQGLNEPGRTLWAKLDLHF